EPAAAAGSRRSPIRVALLRGGIARDEGWARTPDQPLIAVSTVDQVGSRLLFRGYGLSAGMRPIHAGLLGNDALLLLDEVHLSNPFAETLDAIGQRYRWSAAQLPDRWQVVRMSATARDGTGAHPFTLDDADRAHDVLRRRLEARKPVHLEEVKVAGAEAARELAFARAFADRALAAAASPGAVVGVVVNRVARARLVAAETRARAGGTVEVALVTGRMRPVDRIDLEARLGPRVRAGRVRSHEVPPLVVVSTQCIEAGADYDFDALITECASLDALRQRFGRLDRLGELESAPGTILIRSDAVGDEADPVYGAALANTWSFLGSVPGLGFGLAELRIPEPADLALLLPEAAQAPVLLPQHLDAWVQTSPEAEPDPDVALWLHGPERGAPEVQVVWRADIVEAELAAGEQEAVLARLEACPPSSGEAIALPLHVVRAWLAGEQGAGDVTDVEGARAEEEQSPGGVRTAVIWAGERSRLLWSANELRPEMTLVVPASYGGLTDGSWDPAATEMVHDLGDRAAREQRGRAVLRLDARVLAPWIGAVPSLPVPESEHDADRDDAVQIRPWLEAVAGAADLPSWLRGSAAELLRDLSASRRPCRILRFEARAEEDVATSSFALLGRRRVAGANVSGVTTEEEEGSFSSVEVPLAAHLDGVEAVARDFATRTGLPDALVNDLALAGALHDLGKADPRFQVLLHGGSPFKALTAPGLLAKSSAASGDRASRRRAAERSGWPPGARHEVVSLALCDRTPALLAGAADPELVCHLVASHHGWCRPLAPVVLDGAPVQVSVTHRSIASSSSSAHGLERLDSGVSARFWRLVGRYGWFGLAWLEAILRLADHRQSEAEQLAGEEER
ncbi:MAG: type I-U CRISPR-associated helicase/endonuclease Cas3, partial [Myxococcota bacterium]|nr:type I-U CRISPR-associated helicase/endonuclease Cas3 [Myxococcota bacterium]